MIRKYHHIAFSIIDIPVFMKQFLKQRSGILMSANYKTCSKNKTTRLKQIKVKLFTYQFTTKNYNH